MKRARKPKVGRPPDGDETASELVKLRVTAATREAWTAAAEREGVSLSEWLRAAADRELGRKPEPPRKLAAVAAQLRAIADDLG